MSFLKKIFGKTTQVGEDNRSKESLLELYRDKIYPWIKVTFSDDDPRNTSPQFELTGEDSIISKTWIGDLIIFYAADTGENFQILLERDVPKEITKEELHQLAIDNLNRDVEYKLHDTNFGGYGLIAGGDHEAGSICLPGVWDWLSENLNDNLIIGIPAKDLVVFVPESDTDKISNLKIFVYDIFKTGERLLTRNIFKFDRNSKEWSIIKTI